MRVNKECRSFDVYNTEDDVRNTHDVHNIIFYDLDSHMGSIAELRSIYNSVEPMVIYFLAFEHDYTICQNIICGTHLLKKRLHTLSKGMKCEILFEELINVLKTTVLEDIISMARKNYIDA